ncbi:MAG: PEP/pyruvate-binding domain-containing protein [Desulfobaccales bacterium]|nr:PEP/pyruvate-binding domain-containing protein [Desulfobaccales bacterium]
MGLFDFFRRKKKPAPPAPSLKEIWRGFQRVLSGNNEALVLMGDLEEKLLGHDGFDLHYLRSRIDLLDGHLADLVSALQAISGSRWPELENARGRIKEAIHQRLAERPPCPDSPLLVRLEEATPELMPALGGKAGNLVRVKNQLHLPVPDGVVATLAAYRLFMEQEHPSEPGTLLERLSRRLAVLDLADETLVEKTSRELQAMVLAQPVPEELAGALVAEARRLAGPEGRGLAVRSSGAREDIAATFAGQYESYLGVAPNEVPERWRQVVASQFGERALIYFKIQGLLLEEAAMGVLIQRLVEARAAGVMFTTDPESGDSNHMVISAVWGLAADLMGGQVSADEYLVAKDRGRLLKASYGCKDHRLVFQDGRLIRQAVEPELVEAPALDPGDLEQLAAFARILENYCGCPHDVEWVKDLKGQIYLVQSRHLNLAGDRVPLGADMAGAVSGAKVLLEGGRVGSQGVAAGPVFRLYDGRNLADVPAGVVLVAPRTTPKLAPVLPRIAAIVTDVGSATGHLALVAREYGVPALVDTLKAGELLTEGQEVTVDAFHGKVYLGRVEELLRYQRRPTLHLLNSPLHEKLRAVVDLIAPLNLVDRRSSQFRPENCRTYHDVTRFAHEKAIQVMFGLMDSVEQGRVPALRLLKLKTSLPLNLHLVDLGDGLASHETPVPPEDILSVPMRALWRGISHPGISWAGPVPVNLGGFLQVLGQTAIRPPERFWDKTYAIVAANFVNYACRLGYHFQSVDSYCGPVAADNYINFAFKGGAADETRRIRRIRLIAYVLEKIGFEVEIHLDVIRARFRKRPAAETEERLDLVGRLMAYVRQMDMVMSDDDIPLVLADRFLAGHYDRPGEERGE